MEQPTAQTNAAPTNLSQQPAAPPVPWTGGDIFLAVIVGVGVLLGMVPLASAALHLLDAEWTKHLTGMLVSVAELGLLLPIWLFGVHKYRVSWRHVGFRRFDVSRGLSLGCLFLLVSFAFNFVWSLLLLGLADKQAQPDMLPLFGGGGGGLAVALLAGSLVAPIAEEAFFRGYVFAGLRKYVGFRAAVVLSAALFAAAHILPTSMPPIFVLGVLFALLYDRTGSIWPAAAMHAAMNALAFLASYALQVLPM